MWLLLFLQQMCTDLFSAHCRQIGRCDIKYGLASGYAFICQSLGCSCVCYQNAGCEFRIGIQLQSVFDDVLVCSISGCTTADHESTVRNSFMVFVQVFLLNKVNRCIIICKVVRHCYNIMFDLLQICAFFCYYIAFSGMLLSGSQFRILSITN